VGEGCPLCAGQALAYHRDEQRAYLQCTRCELVFVAPQDRIDRRAEFALYCLHENSVDDPGYRQFLQRLAGPLCERLAPASRGLDFGCGPAPALAAMLEEAGHRVALHDSFFSPAPELLEQRYDFITATEVVEHLHRPGPVLAQLWDCLLPGAWLGVMTKLVRDREAFAGWHYKRDPTHVCFFSRATWRFWADQRDAEPLFPADDVMLMRKPLLR
jgi:SAM-dependent methyltransferase